MDMSADLAPAEALGQLGTSVMQLLGPGYLDALGLLPHHGCLTPGMTPPLPDLGEHIHNHQDLLQAYLSGTGPVPSHSVPLTHYQHAHHGGLYSHQGLDGLLGMGGLGPLPGTTVDNPLSSFVIGKAGGDAHVDMHAWTASGGGQLPGGSAGGDGPCAAASEQTEGGDFDPRAMGGYLGAAHDGAHALEGMVEVGGVSSRRPGPDTDFLEGSGGGGPYEGMGLLGAHFPGTPPQQSGGGDGRDPGASKPSPSSVLAPVRRGARGRDADGDAAPPRKAGAAGAGDKGPRSSQFRGVTKHRRSGRYEAHIWVKDLGRQVYLGGYECEEHAAEAYDIAALKCKGRRGCKTNFDLPKYADLLGCINRMTMEELVMAVRRQSQGFSRGTSSFRGVTHHPSGRWEARIGVPGSKHIYLGLFVEERDAARAYDRALVRLRGRGAATNFALGDYKVEMADYHKMQARILGADAHFSEISSNPSLFERWVKGGCEAFPELGSNPSSHTQIHNVEGSSDNVGGPPMLLHAPAASESKSPLTAVPYSHHAATASSGRQ